MKRAIDAIRSATGICAVIVAVIVCALADLAADDREGER